MDKHTENYHPYHLILLGLAMLCCVVMYGIHEGYATERVRYETNASTWIISGQYEHRDHHVTEESE